MFCTVGEMAKKLGVAPSTLRYYDKEGLLPFVARSEGGVRLFKEADQEWLKIIVCLKKTGMPLRDIREFVQMAMEGDRTIESRLALIIKQKETVKAQIEDMEATLRILEFKEWYYETAKANGSTAVPRNMSSEELPEAFRKVRAALCGAKDEK